MLIIDEKWFNAIISDIYIIVSKRDDQTSLDIKQILDNYQNRSFGIGITSRLKRDVE